VSAALTLTTARTDDPLAGVTVPVAAERNPNATKPSHLQQVHAELVSQLPVPDGRGGVHHTMPPLETNSDYRNYIRARTAAWKASKNLKAPIVRPSNAATKTKKAH
jgi:phospholipase C